MTQHKSLWKIRDFADLPSRRAYRSVFTLTFGPSRGVDSFGFLADWIVSRIQNKFSSLFSKRSLRKMRFFSGRLRGAREPPLENPRQERVILMLLRGKLLFKHSQAFLQRTVCLNGNGPFVVMWHTAWRVIRIKILYLLVIPVFNPL